VERRLPRRLAAVLLLASSVTGCDPHAPSRTFATRTSTAQPQAGGALVEPPVLASRAGRLTVELDAAPGSFAIGGEQFTGMLYDGAYIPPVWRVGAGDILTVTLHNRLPEMTNLHFHGMEAPPGGNADNIFVHVQPGASFTYSFTVPEHPGLFWYHPHAHGRTSAQIIGGMSGAILVEGDEDYYPFLAGLHARLLLLKHIPHTQADYEELVTVNGQVAPSISIRPGEVQLWRVANIGADLFLKIAVVGMPFYVVASDGHYLGHPTRMDEVLLGPGGRIEAAVVGGRSGRYVFASTSFVMEEGRPPLPAHALGTVVSEGPAADVAAVASRVEAETVDHSRYIDVLRASPIARRRTMTFSRTEDRSKFFINQQQFDERRTDVTVKLGDIEEWTLVNADNQLHNFHIHQTEFLVTEIDGVPQRMDSLYDTFTLPAAKDGKPSTVRVVIPFTNPAIVGRFVFHCHVVKHEDKGMMQTIEVVAPPASSPRRRRR
jgi:FtsP/CotA-like multicopper oxidase with cupredoxin domain